LEVLLSVTRKRILIFAGVVDIKPRMGFSQLVDEGSDHFYPSAEKCVHCIVIGRVLPEYG
jgi:hypothetical protein